MSTLQVHPVFGGRHCPRGCVGSEHFRGITDGTWKLLRMPYLPQAWDEPKYRAEGVKVCGALLADCYNSDTQVINHPETAKLRDAIHPAG